MELMRPCKICRVEIPVSMYPKKFSKKTGKYYAYSYCKPCANRKSIEWQRNNKDRAYMASKKYKIKATFGISLEDFDRILAGQGGCCAICGSTETGGKGRMPVDHCHATGKIRGILCAPCNKGLGHFRENPETMARAIAYLISGDSSAGHGYVPGGK